MACFLTRQKGSPCDRCTADVGNVMTCFCIEKNPEKYIKLITENDFYKDIISFIDKDASSFVDKKLYPKKKTGTALPPSPAGSELVYGGLRSRPAGQL